MTLLMFRRMSQMKNKHLKYPITFLIIFTLIFGTFGTFDALNNKYIFAEKNVSKAYAKAKDRLQENMERCTNEIHIDSYDKLIEFARKCSLDSYSRDKKVILDKDITFPEGFFEPIPTFGGLFEGNNHTIKNVGNNTPMSSLGLFRILQKGGVIQNLNVEGIMRPSGQQKDIGGIVGSNFGIISDCTFRGSVNADSSIGGIVGTNQKDAYIFRCESDGNIIGTSYIGGIVGYNLGHIEKCVNRAKVNTTYVDTPISSERISNSLENILQTGDVNSAENVHVRTDAGGIVGFNTGTVKSSENHADIGYEHVGYNTGGIAGRSEGFIQNCKNTGTIKGRKDIGGITGQLQPYIELDFTPDTIDSLNSELAAISNLSKGMITSTGSANSDINSHLNKMTAHANKASDNLKQLSDEASSAVGNALDTNSDVLKNLSSISNEIQNYTNTVTSNADSVRSHIEDYKKNHELTEADQKRLDEDSQKLADGSKQMSDSANKLSDITKAADEYAAKYVEENSTEETTKEEKAKMYSRKYVEYLNTDEKKSEITKCFTDFFSAISSMSKATENASKFFADKIVGTVKDYDGSGITDSIKTLSSSLKNVPDSASKIDKMIQSLNNLNDTLGTSNAVSDHVSENVYASLSSMLSEFAYIQDKASNEVNNSLSKMESIRKHMDNIRNIVTDNAKKTRDKSVDPKDNIEDISGTDISKSTTGRITACSNDGDVNSDNNSGGIIGLASIEYDFNPEDDIAQIGKTSINYEMKTKAIVDSCKNNGSIYSKNQYAGGIAGHMEMGIIYTCENYGEISCEGDYVGGIIGYSKNTVLQSYAKCYLSGAKYIGGIAGYGYEIKNCSSMVNVRNYTQNVGAIAGCLDSESASKVLGNTYYSKKLQGIDGISYDKIAEGTSYDKMLKQANIPEDFKALRITFKADDKIISNILVKYGSELKKSDIPKVPSKEGFHGTWDRTDFSKITEDVTVTAEYGRVGTLIGSDLTRDSGVRILLADGHFKENDKLLISLLPIGDTTSIPDEKKVIETGKFGNKIEYLPIESIKIIVPEDGSKSHVFRYLPPTEMSSSDLSKVKICLDTKDGIKELNSSTYGKYVTFEAEGQVFNIIVYSPDTNNFLNSKLVIIIPTILGVIILLFIIKGIVKRRKRKSSKKESEKTESTDKANSKDVPNKKS